MGKCGGDGKGDYLESVLNILNIGELDTILNLGNK